MTPWTLLGKTAGLLAYDDHIDPATWVAFCGEGPEEKEEEETENGIDPHP